jgi:hypothetical protein
MQSTVAGSPLLDSKSLAAYPSQETVASRLPRVPWLRINRVILELFEVVVYIRSAWKLVQFRRVQPFGILKELNGSVVGEFVRSSVFSCGVLTSGQRKLKK